MNQYAQINQFKSFAQMLEVLPNDTACREYLENIRWSGSPICPQCGGINPYQLKQNGEFRGMYKCSIKLCKQRFTVTVGTMFEGSHISLRKWFIALYIFSTHKKGISSHQLARDLGVTQKTGWFMYGRIADDVYEIALSFVIERTIFCLDGLKDKDKILNIIIEKRGKKEDKKLSEHFQKIQSRGTGYVDSTRLKSYKIDIDFKDKKDNDNGLQLADLVAYPIARYILDEERANPAFEIIKHKFYTKDGKRYGLKIFPKK